MYIQPFPGNYDFNFMMSIPQKHEYIPGSHVVYGEYTHGGTFEI